MSADWGPLSELHAAIADAQAVSDGPSHYQPGYGYGYLTAAGPVRPDQAIAQRKRAAEAVTPGQQAALEFLTAHPEFCRHQGNCPGHPVTEVLEHMKAPGQDCGEITAACWEDSGKPVPGPLSCEPPCACCGEEGAAPEPALSRELFGDAAGIWAALSARTWLGESELPQYGAVYPGHCSGCLLPGTWKAGKCWYCCKAADLAAAGEDQAAARVSRRAALWLGVAALAFFTMVTLLCVFGGS